MKIVYCIMVFMSIGAVEPEAQISNMLPDPCEDRRIVTPRYLEADDYYTVIRAHQAALSESPECDECDCVVVTCAAWYLVRLFFNGC